MRISGHRFVTELFNMYLNPFLTHITDVPPVSGQGDGRIANYIHATREKLYQYEWLESYDILTLGDTIVNDIVGLTLYNPEFLEQNTPQLVYQYINPFCQQVAQYGEKGNAITTFYLFTPEGTYVKKGTVTIYPTDNEQQSQTFQVEEQQPLPLELMPGIYLVRATQETFTGKSQDETIAIAIQDSEYSLTLGDTTT